ncbi:MAG: GFA family protein [Parvularculaceae bacterium]
MGETKTYQGGCHCGAVRFKAEADLSDVKECNCSHCSKKGFLLTFMPADNFRLLSGGDKLTEYRFNKKAISHLFCSVCGVQAFGRGKGPGGAEMAAVNVRCLDDIDLSTLEPQPVDGKSL